jgi:CheY-like chemotaxis protein
MCQVLIVEDESSVSEILDHFFESLKFTYKIASNAIEALLILDKHQAVRLCLIDLHMPGMDGLTLCRKIKARDPMMICIASTGFPTLFSLVECRQAGFDDVVFKPFDFETLKRVVLEYDAKLQRWAKS